MTITMTDPRYLKTDTCLRRAAGVDFPDAAAQWEVWHCEGPTFEHSYDRAVTLYVDQGVASIAFSTGQVVDLQRGDLLTIEVGAKAVWTIRQSIRNLYRYH